MRERDALVENLKKLRKKILDEMCLNVKGINYSGSKNYELQDTRGPFKQM